MAKQDKVLRGIRARLRDDDWPETLFYVVDDLCEQRGLPGPSDGWSRDPKVNGFHQELGELWRRYDDTASGSTAERFAKRQLDGCLDRFARYVKG